MLTDEPTAVQQATSQPTQNNQPDQTASQPAKDNLKRSWSIHKQTTATDKRFEYEFVEQSASGGHVCSSPQANGCCQQCQRVVVTFAGLQHPNVISSSVQVRDMTAQEAHRCAMRLRSIVNSCIACARYDRRVFSAFGCAAATSSLTCAPQLKFPVQGYHPSCQATSSHIHLSGCTRLPKRVSKMLAAQVTKLPVPCGLTVKPLCHLRPCSGLSWNQPNVCW